jgi:hypothetical protein
MRPLTIAENDQNSLRVELPAGDSLTVFPAFYAESGFRPTAAKDLWLSRVLAGRVLECQYAAVGEKRSLQLHGPDPHGHFHVVHVPRDGNLFVRLDAMAGYQFSPGGSFLKAHGLLSLARWFSGTAFAVVAQGPCNLIFYGPDLVYSEMQERPRCFTRRLVAFDARVPFRVRGLRPEGSVGTIFDALSSVVEATFQRDTPLVRRTAVETGRAHGNVWKAVQLVSGGLIIGPLLEHLLVSRWLWSWIL